MTFTFQKANNQGDNKTALMRRLVCTLNIMFACNRILFSRTGVQLSPQPTIVALNVLFSSIFLIIYLLYIYYLCFICVRVGVVCSTGLSVKTISAVFLSNP